MKISGKIIKKKAVIITPEYLEELCRLLLRFSEKLTFEATTYSNSDITFDDIHELLCYDNFNRHRLKSLHITGYKKYERTISLYIEKDTYPFSARRYDRTIYGVYQFESVDSETLFINEFEKWFEKIKSSYWLLGKFSVSGTIFIPSAIITIFRLIVGGSLAIDVPEDITGVLLILLAILIAGVIVVLADFIDIGKSISCNSILLGRRN